MQCEEFETWLNEVLDRRARPEEDPELLAAAESEEDRQATLSACAALLDGVRARTLPPLPDDLTDRVLAQVERKPRGAGMTKWAAPLAVAAVVLVAVSLAIVNRAPEENPKPQLDPGPEVAVQRLPKDPLGREVPGEADEVDEAYLAVFHNAGRAVAVLSDKVRGPVPAEVEPVAARIRPVTNSVGVAFHALRNTLPKRDSGSES